MRKFFLLICLTVLFAGCGYDGSSPAYDTDANPQGFPAAAVELLEAVESQQVTSFDEIGERFGDLYTQHGDLLDNQDWHAVIHKLGLRFKHWADSLADLGPTHYTPAAGYYQLAAFAQQENPEITAMARTFGAWFEERRDSLSALLMNSLDDNTDATTRLRLVKQFMLDDSSHQAFAREYLVDQLFTGDRWEIKPEEAAEFSAANAAFASWLGLIEKDFVNPIAQFGDPPIDLVALALPEIEPGIRRAELYFFPRGPIDQDYEVMVRILMRDTLTPARFSALDFAPFAIVPASPTSTWQPHEISAAFRRIQFRGPLTQIAVGIVDRSVDPPAYLSIKDVDEQLVKVLLEDGAMP